jgi:mevalonate kinase
MYLFLMIKVSAPGKVHLMGDHAIVYGEPAILAAIGKRSYCEAEKHHRVRVISRTQSVEVEWPLEETIDAAMQAQAMWMKGFESGDFSSLFRFIKDGQNFKRVAIGLVLHRLNIPSGVFIQSYTEIPLGSGLGSSSAAAVCYVKAIAELYEKQLSLEEVNKIAFDIEKLTHGNPSGGDNTACCFGGLIWFQKDEKGRFSIESLKQEIPYPLDNFILTYIKKPEKTTGELISHVRNLDPEFRTPRVKAIGQASRELRTALRNKDFNSVKIQINNAWKSLSELGLSIPEADDLIARIRQIGGAAKLCGSLGGGVLLAFHEDKKILKNLIREAGYTPWETELGSPGVRLE